MTFEELKRYIRSDYERYRKYGVDRMSILFFTPGFIYCFYMRLCSYLKTTGFHTLYRPLYILCRIILKHYEYKFGIQIPYFTKIGYGFYIGHFGNIVIHPGAVIGNNVNISQGITIGFENNGVPTIGDDVYIGAGAKVIGKVTVGNNVAIGANCVETKSVPDHAIVVGVPGKVISFKGNRNRSMIRV